MNTFIDSHTHAKESTHRPPWQQTHIHTLVTCVFISGIVCCCGSTDSCSCAAGQRWSRVPIGPSCKRARACPPQMMTWSPWKCLAIVQSSREIQSIKTLTDASILWEFKWPSSDVFSIPEFASAVYIHINEWILKWWETDQPIKRHRLHWLVSFFKLFCDCGF